MCEAAPLDIGPESPTLVSKECSAFSRGVSTRQCLGMFCYRGLPTADRRRPVQPNLRQIDASRVLDDQGLLQQRPSPRAALGDYTGEGLIFSGSPASSLGSPGVRAVPIFTSSLLSGSKFDPIMYVSLTLLSCTTTAEGTFRSGEREGGAAQLLVCPTRRRGTLAFILISKPRSVGGRQGSRMVHVEVASPDVGSPLSIPVPRSSLKCYLFFFA